MSHTAIMLLAGLALLIVLRLTIRDTARATRMFLILWLRSRYQRSHGGDEG